MTFNSEFLRVVFDEDEGYGEGWGKTRFGWYLGNYGGAWHKADAPLDADNSPLKTNSVAVDKSLIPTDSIVTIPGLPGEFGKKHSSPTMSVSPSTANTLTFTRAKATLPDAKCIASRLKTTMNCSEFVSRNQSN